MLFRLPLWFLLASLTMLGAIWGSFVAALCSRWPKGESVVKGRSRCDQCGVQIASYDLLPILSFLMLKGKCRNCRQKIGPMPFGIELGSILIGAISVLVLPESQAIAAAVFGWLLLPLVLLDHQHLWLPNRLVLLLAATGLLVGPMLTPGVDLLDRIVAMSIGFLSLEAIRVAYKKYRQNDGMGAGDPKLCGALGIWLGWQALPIVLLGASTLGLVIIFTMRLTANLSRNALPFGSYLGIAAYLAALLG